MEKIRFFWIFLSSAKFISQKIHFLGRKKVQFSLQLVKLVLKFIEKQKIFEKKNVADFGKYFENRQFSKIFKIAKFAHFQMPVKSKPENSRIQFFTKIVVFL